MKTFSISAVIMLALLLGFIPTLPKSGLNTAANVASTKEAHKGLKTSPKTAPKSFLTDTYHGNGFYTYTKTLSLPGGCSCS